MEMNLIESSIDLSQFVEPENIHQVRDASRFKKRTLDILNHKNQAIGVPLPWAKAHNLIELRPGELSIWTGYKGHGKSMLLSQAMLHVMRLGNRVLIVSPEFKPEEVLARKCRQESGSSRPPSSFVDEWFEYAKSRLWLFDHQGALNSDNVVALCRYAVATHGITHIVIDSLMKCGIGVGSDDYTKQKHFVDKLQSVAHQVGPHIHLVAHARKGSSDDAPAGLHDVKGTSEIADMAENVFSVWRNKPKHKAMSSGDQSKAHEPDAILVCESQRNGSGWNGSLQFWFDPQSCQYLESLNDNPKCYMPSGASSEVVEF
jgi:twinkle protein